MDFTLLRLFTIVLTSATILTTTSVGAGCYDLATGEPHSLSGMLYYTIAPGPPNFQDVKRGDTPEPIYVLRLSQPICLTGDEFADPTKLFLEVQLVPRDEIANAMRSVVNSNVSVTLTQPMAAITGHHHRPLVAWVTAISRTTPIEPTDDITKDYGTAATSVRAFYYALGDGNGDQAALFIVPERRKGPFSPSDLTRFYGELIQPLRLSSIMPVSENSYLVRYSFKSNSGRCNGRAVVTTTTRGNDNLIYSIKALDGC